MTAGRALKERQCTLEGQAWYVNVRDSAQSGEWTLGVNS